MGTMEKAFEAAFSTKDSSSFLPSVAFEGHFGESAEVDGPTVPTRAGCVLTSVF